MRSVMSQINEYDDDDVNPLPVAETGLCWLGSLRVTAQIWKCAFLKNLMCYFWSFSPRMGDPF